MAADRQATGVQQCTKDDQQQCWRSAQTLSMALQRLRVSSEENSPTEHITSLGLFIPSKDRQASWDLWDAGEGRDASTAHCRHTWSLTTKTTEWLDGTLSPCRMLGSLCGTTVSFSDINLHFTGISLQMEEAQFIARFALVLQFCCCFFLMSWQNYQKVLEKMTLQKLQCF